VLGVRPTTALAVLAACAVLGAGCSKGGGGSDAQASASPAALSPGETASPSVAESSSAAPVAAASGAVTVAFTDLGSAYGAKEINDLGRLGVFEASSGAFNPSSTITRADYVRWLVKANNAIWADDPSRQIRPSSAGKSAYPDVATSHADFAYIQGMFDSGFAVGFPDKTFKPDVPITHEQMIAIKESVDRGGVDKYYVDFWDSTMPNWKDRLQVNKQFRGAVAEDSYVDRTAKSQGQPTYVIDNVGRSFGAVAMFRPQQPVTRAEAALSIWKIGAHTDKRAAGEAPRSAADALAPPTPAATPTT
jgi:S-layer family protein